MTKQVTNKGNVNISWKKYFLKKKLPATAKLEMNIFQNWIYKYAQW